MINFQSQKGNDISFAPNQLAMLAAYTKEYNRPYNSDLFKRDEKDIVECLKNIILSAQRHEFFTIQVTGFNEIRSYREVQKRLRELEAHSNNKRKKFNSYEYINLKDSDVMLLEVFYHLETDEESYDTSVVIQVPIVTNKYYFRINGCYYSSMYQIVDASTYNNTSMGSVKIPAVTMKSAFSKTVIHKMEKRITAVDKTVYKCNSFVCDIFANKICAEKFILCKYGLNRTMNFLGLHEIYLMKMKTEFTDGELEVFYFFKTENPDIMIRCPKFLFANEMYQSMCYTLSKCASKDHTLEEMYTEGYWLESQGAELKTKTETKGRSFRESFEVSIDINTYNHFRLPPDQKESSYCILRWILQNFNPLCMKDNCNLATKRVRFGEYIAIHYARKLAYSIRRIANLTSKVNMKKLKQVVQIKHSYLIDQLKSKCTLINYNNAVNDDDCILGLSYSFKGITGIGENKASAVPTKYKLVNPSHLGRVDMTDSSNSDPGMSGTLIPYLKLEDGYMSDFQEPCKGGDDLNRLYEEYKRMNNIVEVSLAKRMMLGSNGEWQTVHNQLLAFEDMIKNVSTVASSLGPAEEIENGYPLDPGGNIKVEYLTPGIDIAI